MHRGDEDDAACRARAPAPVLPPHPPHRLARGQEGAVEIDRHDLAPVVEAHLGEAGIGLYPCVDHDAVDPAEAVLEAVEGACDVVLLRHVAADGDRLAARLGDLARDRPSRLLAMVVADADPRAVRAEPPRGALPDPAAAAGDEDDRSVGHLRPPDSWL